jgi:hypothetical protein
MGRFRADGQEEEGPEGALGEPQLVSLAPSIDGLPERGGGGHRHPQGLGQRHGACIGQHHHARADAGGDPEWWRGGRGHALPHHGDFGKPQATDAPCSYRPPLRDGKTQGFPLALVEALC